MSLLWPNRLEILLTAQGAALASLPATGQSMLKKTFVAPLDNQQLPNWQVACNSLEALLSSLNLKPNTQLTIVLSSDFVKYQLLPAQQVYMSSAEKMAYAAATYKEIYGLETDAWKIKLHETGFNEASITAALDEALLAKLQQVSQQHQIKLVSVQAYLMSAYNNCKTQLSRLSGYFALVEANQLLLISMLQGSFLSLRIHHVSKDWQHDLKQLLQRESMLNAVNGKDVLIYTQDNQAISRIEGWELSTVNTKQKHRTNAYHAASIKAMT